MTKLMRKGRSGPMQVAILISGNPGK